MSAPVEIRFATVRVRMPDRSNYGEKGTFSTTGDVVGIRLTEIGDRTVISVPVGAGEITLQVPSENVEVIS